MADLGMSFCRRSRPEAIHRTVFLAARSKAAGRAAPNRVQRLQTAFGSPGRTPLEVLQQWKAA